MDENDKVNGLIEKAAALSRQQQQMQRIFRNCIMKSTSSDEGRIRYPSQTSNPFKKCLLNRSSLHPRTSYRHLKLRQPIRKLNQQVLTGLQKPLLRKTIQL